ncbi:23S rRNA (cytidine(2498)-2'-O)-methyltransferase RlmM [Pelagibaculum spongiae]|uniref:Ribosomal RNA large subunit methyltransferase M n=1 Tax=Pelagibaculum spongiae TaxID=2080658 RepID=A0A2V1GWC1_9GAMM|nr:23S rRNA (cytidine(2498)-2'-O)-methyltransferase RlmM [Pelagibaculum spongiae]PVZ65390.1 23S rRNA (cytidine(2498)-2'-O)-methyltransferase RlmM [Pelagibaculum spongiae]
MQSLLLYCRPGFESACAAEITDLAAMSEVYGYAKTERESGLVLFDCGSQESLEHFASQLSFQHVVFSRQIVLVAPVLELSAEDRLTPIMLAATELPVCGKLFIESADTNEGKALSALCRKFKPHFERSLVKQKRLQDKESLPWMHLIFESGTRAWLGISLKGRRSPWPMGIRRLKMPGSAPSRSTLKLEEAFHYFLTREKWPEYLKPMTTAVDLGAAPGGWTWQFVERGIKVIAIDNGPMEHNLMGSGLVKHIRADGFTYRPSGTVDWLVCDMVEKPARVVERMATWLEKGWSRRAIFNLKLPMKQPWRSVKLYLEQLTERLPDHSIRAKQLYHDREEITVCILPLEN